jgi:hypothetical protein
MATVRVVTAKNGSEAAGAWLNDRAAKLVLVHVCNNSEDYIDTNLVLNLVSYYLQLCVHTAVLASGTKFSTEDSGTKFSTLCVQLRSLLTFRRYRTASVPPGIVNCIVGDDHMQ